jgi:hypothetical protein
MEENIKVYVVVDNDSIINEINSNLFIDNLEEWIQIDEGQGDKYSHAQGNYLDKGLMDMQSKYNYKLVDGKVVELTEEEKATLFPTLPTLKTEMEILKETVDALVLANLGV